jgi:hypothetical protein
LLWLHHDATQGALAAAQHQDPAMQQVTVVGGVSASVTLRLFRW